MAIKLKPRVGGKHTGGGTPQQARQVELPDVIEMNVEDVRPSILLQGGSGTGKTHGIGRMMAAGLNGLVLAIEPKVQTIMRYKPKVLFLGAPVQQGGKLRPPTPVELYDRLMRFRDALGEGKYREHNGKALDFIATDGFLELGDVIYKYWKANRPLSSSTGEKNSFAMWDNVAEKSVDFFKSMRDAAGMASTTFGLPPIGTVATIGEDDIDELGATKHVPLFPGKKAGKLLPYCFEVVLRLSVRNTEGQVEYIAHTCAQNDPTCLEKFYAKVPSGLFDQEIINPDLGDIYRKVIDNYKQVDEVNRDE